MLNFEFKSESNHQLILQVLSEIKLTIKPSIMNKIRLILINLSEEENQDYIKNLESLVTQLNLEEHVIIYPQCKNATLEKQLIKTSYGIYAKDDDNFESDVIFGLAAEQIMVIHTSGACQNELIELGECQNRYLAKTVKEYAHSTIQALSLSDTEKWQMQKSARKTAEQFTGKQYQKQFLKIIEGFFKTKTA